MTVIVQRSSAFFGSPIVKLGIGYGSVAAMILSYNANQSILWMLIDGWLNWFYVIYFALLRA
jgi:hypothetical protein